MSKYTVSTDGKAGPYLVIDPKDYDAIIELLRQKDILFAKSSEIKDGNTGEISLKIVDIEPQKIKSLNKALAENFPDEDLNLIN